jgi:4-hydroxy-tetrahydrodipicolinate synthase
MGSRQLRGVFPILNTTFEDDGSLDLASQENLVRYLIEEQGAHGLGLFGNASEGYALSDDERVELLKIVRRAAGDTPLIASTGHSGTQLAVDLSRKAEALGANALMVLPPSFMKTDADGLMFYYDSISKAVNIPIMVQDAPLMTGVAMPAALLARMAREIEHVQYAKVEGPPTAPKVSAVVKAGGIVVFGGLNGNFYIEEYNRGARGVMPGSDMIGHFVQMWNALESGDEPAAWRIFTRILPLIRFELQPGLGVCAMKNNLKAAAVIRSAFVRHPTGQLDETAHRELAHLRAWIASEQSLAAVES